MSWQSDWKVCKNILCIRPDNIGDVILMTPAFRALKESLPGVKISLLTSSVGSQIVPFIPGVDECLVYDAPWIESDKIKSLPNDVASIVSQLKQKNFDGAVLLTNYSQNPLPLAFLAYLAGIPRVLSYCRELPN